MKKFLISLLSLMSLNISAWAAPSGAITNYTNIESGKKYYIGATTGNTDYYLKLAQETTGNSVAGTGVTDVEEATVFTFTGSNTSWTIQLDNGNYIALKSSKDNGKVIIQTSIGNWTLSNPSSLIRLAYGSSYSLQKNNSATNFGSYANAQTDVWLLPVPSSGGGETGGGETGGGETGDDTVGSSGGSGNNFVGETIILPGGSTTVSAGDWNKYGAPKGYPSSATEYTISDYGSVTLSNVADYNNGDGLQFKKSSAYLETTMTSIAGVTVVVNCATAGMTISLTGASNKTSVVGDNTLTTTSTTATLKITNGTSNAAYVKYIKLEPKQAAAPTYYTVKLNNHGELYQTWTQSPGKLALSLPNITEPYGDWTFIAWSAQPIVEDTYDNVIEYDYIYEYDNDFTPTQDITLYAVYANSQDVCTTSPTLPTAAEMTGISVTKLPDKTEYFVGESLNLTGIEVTATYDNSTTQVLTSELTFSPANGATLTTVGSQTVTVTYGEFNTSFTVTVKAVPMCAVTWSVNGVAGEPQNVKQGDPLSFPIAPQGDAESDIVFVGWTAASSVASSGQGIVYLADGATAPNQTEVTYYAVFASQSQAGGGVLTYGWEDSEPYASKFTNTNFTSGSKSNVTAHQGTKIGYNDTNVAGNSCSISTNEKKPITEVKFYYTKTSTNTTSQNWILQTSSNGTTWTTHDTKFSASEATRYQWSEAKWTLDGSEVFVKITMGSNNTAQRVIDDLTIKYGTSQLEGYTLTYQAKQSVTMAYSAQTATALVDQINATLPTLTALYPDNSSIDAADLQFDSSNKSVADFDNEGNLTMKSVGTTIITATFAATAQYKGASAQFTLTVEKNQASVFAWSPAGDIEFFLDEVPASLPVLVAKDANGNDFAPSYRQFTYSATNGVATVDDAGKVVINSENKAGAVTITAKLNHPGYEYQEAKIKVTTKHHGNTAYRFDGTFTEDSTISIEAMDELPSLPTLNNPNGLTVTYSVSSEPAGLATIDSATGVLTLTNGTNKAGTITVTAVGKKLGYADATVSYTLEIVRKTATAEFQNVPEGNVDISGANPFVEPTIATNSDGVATYSSSNTSVATVNANTGKVDLIKPGTVTITATIPQTDAYTTVSTSYTIQVVDSNMPEVLYYETFGSSSKETAFDTSFLTATPDMFTNNTVAANYTSDGKIGKNTTTAPTVSEASGQSDIINNYGNGAGTYNLVTVDNINIADKDNLNLSFWLNFFSGEIVTQSKLIVNYQIDDNPEETFNYTVPSSKRSWELISGQINGTGNKLKLKFTVIVTGGYIVRVDDIKVTGKVGKKDPCMAFALPEYVAPYGAVNYAGPEYVSLSNGKVTYAVDDTDVAVLTNSSVHNLSIIDGGSATVTATMGASDLYRGATAGYILRVPLSSTLGDTQEMNHHDWFYMSSELSVIYTYGDYAYVYDHAEKAHGLIIKPNHGLERENVIAPGWSGVVEVNNGHVSITGSNYVVDDQGLYHEPTVKTFCRENMDELTTDMASYPVHLTHVIFYKAFPQDGGASVTNVVLQSAASSTKKLAPARAQAEAEAPEYSVNLRNMFNLPAVEMPTGSDKGKAKVYDYVDGFVHVNNGQLEIYPTALSDEVVTGVESVTDDADGEVHYYNLQGIEVKNPAPGIYIRVSNHGTSKVVM